MLFLSFPGSSYSCWTRWGRLGENGQSKLDPADSLPDAVKKFGKKFKDKTKNNWDDRFAFVKHDKKYQLVETTGEEDGDSADAALGRLTEEQVGSISKLKINYMAQYLDSRCVSSPAALVLAKHTPRIRYKEV